MKKIVVAVLVLIVGTLHAQVITFPDPAFKAKLLQSDTNNYIAGGVKIDANNDGEITQSEALAVYSIAIQTPSNITNITGIGFFTNIQDFGVQGNMIQTADLTSLTHLRTLDLGSNQLSSINLNGLSNLWFINIGDNQLTSVDFSTLSALKILIITRNQLTQLDFSNNPVFEQLRCNENPNLAWVNIRNNRSQVYSFTPFNGCWTDCPNLTAICVDDNEVVPTQNFLAGCGMTQPITITTDCALSVPEFSTESFMVSPNPSTGVFQLTFNEFISEKGGYAVYDVLGKMILEKEIPKDISTSEINLENYPQGVYLLRIVVGDTVVNKKLIKE